MALDESARDRHLLASCGILSLGSGNFNDPLNGPHEENASMTCAPLSASRLACGLQSFDRLPRALSFR
jgi:hypothetical protein